MIPFKQWRFEEAIRLGLSVNTIGSRYYRDKKYPRLKVKRLNRRVVWVVNNFRTTSPCGP